MYTFSEYCMRYLSDLKYSIMIVLALTFLFMFTTLFAYSVLCLVKFFAVLLPEEQRVEVTRMADRYIKKVDELLYFFRLL